MKRVLLLLMCSLAFLLTVPATQAGGPGGVAASIDRLPGLETALACCTGADRQRCSDVCGGRAFCDQGACLCACPV